MQPLQRMIDEARSELVQLKTKQAAYELELDELKQQRKRGVDAKGAPLLSPEASADLSRREALVSGLIGSVHGHMTPLRTRIAALQMKFLESEPKESGTLARPTPLAS
jgi:hypothetical protein